MKEEKFSSDIVKMVNNSLKKIKNGGVSFYPQFNFKESETIYNIREEESLIDRGNDFKVIYASNVIIDGEFYRQALKFSKQANVLLTYEKLVKTAMFVGLLGQIAKSGLSDVTFQMGVRGQFNKDNPAEIANKPFKTDFYTIRLIKRINRGWSGFNTSYKSPVSEELMKLVNKHEGVYSILEVGTMRTFDVPQDQILSFLVNYM